MITEALVIFACVNSTGCSESSRLYFSQNPNFKKLVDSDAEHARQYIGPSIVDTVGPLLFVAAGGSGTVKINKYFSLQFQRDSGILSFSIDCP